LITTTGAPSASSVWANSPSSQPWNPQGLEVSGIDLADGRLGPLVGFGLSSHHADRTGEPRIERMIAGYRHGFDAGNARDSTLEFVVEPCVAGQRGHLE
jgi:hypothetical protein